MTLFIFMIIAPNSRERKGEKVRTWGEEEGNTDYGGMGQPSH